MEDLARNTAEWENMLLDTAKGLSDLSQQIALSVTSAELVAKELRGCRKRERDSRQPGAGRAHQSEPFRPRPVVGSPTDAMAEEALQSVGMVHDAPIANVVSKTGASTRATKRSKKGGISARELRALQVD